MEKVTAFATGISEWNTINAFQTVERMKDSPQEEDVIVIMDSPDMMESTVKNAQKMDIGMLMLTMEKVHALATLDSEWSTINVFQIVERMKDLLQEEDATVIMDSPDIMERIALESALLAPGGILTKENANANGDTKWSTTNA